MNTFFDWLDRHQGVGLLLARLFVGTRLAYGVIDNVLSWEHMLLFRDFLAAFHFPLPLASAVVSVYAQLIASAMILSGWKIRYAALAMIVNFLIALVVVHRNDPLEPMTPALSMLFFNVVFLFAGAGRLSLDRRSVKTAMPLL